MGARSWTNEQLIEAVKESVSFSEVSRKLGLSNFGANSRTIKKYIVKLQLDISHFLSLNEHLNLVRPKPRTLSNEEMFCVNNIDRGAIKRRIISDNLIPYECAECHISTWRGKPLSLHLDHINGINNDNRLSNLRFLCPNCHSSTDSYCGKNLRGKIYANHTCIDCGVDIGSKSIRCSSCAAQQRNKTKITWPKHDELQVMVDELGYRGAASKLGVSDNGVKKRLKNHPND